jgi:glycosyltransferase involved in cell wall biosynthesis
VFAHFSGVDLAQPGIYSKHQNRFTADDVGDLRPLYDEYLGKLRTNGHPAHKAKPYAYARFADGEPIVPALRHTYRRCFDVGCPEVELHPQRMDRARFNEACVELTDVAGLPISKVMYEVWVMREDLRNAFSLRADAGRSGFIRWYLAAAAAEMRLGDAYVAPIRARFEPRVSPARPRGRMATAALRVFAWGKRHSGLAHLYARMPFAWRLRIRQKLHAVAGMPMPPLPFDTARKRAVRGHAAPALFDNHGVNLLGYARGEFGVAENVRAYARALEPVQYPFSILNFDVGVASRQQDHSLDAHFSDTLPYSRSVFFINADQLPIARSVLGAEAFAGHYNIGFWVWELETFPHEWHGSFDLVDEVWVPTEFVRAGMAAATRKPVLRMPQPIEVTPPTGMGRDHFGLPAEGFVFLYSYDFNSFASRKNPEAAIAAFRQAFAGRASGDARLLIKSVNGTRFPDRLAALAASVADDPRIEVRDGFLTRAEMSGLQNSIDCFVSPHRSEGFGLGMAECMYLGKPVIATGYSGNLDFMDRDNSLLVDYRMVPLHEGDYPFWQGQQWADPDVGHMARLMRNMFDDRELAQRIGANAAASIRRTHSRAACAAAVTQRLERITATGNSSRQSGSCAVDRHSRTSA